MSEVTLPVVAAVLERGDGRLLVAQRPHHLDHGGCWEFPGGKVEPGESETAALARELVEELGIELLESRPLLHLEHRYPKRRVALSFHRVVRWRGEPVGREGQPLRWLPAEALTQLDFPEANRPLLRRLAPPRCCLVTGAADDAGDFMRRLQRGLDRGADLVQYRHRDEPERWQRLARDVIACCQERQVPVVLNAYPVWVERLGADGVHLASRQLLALQQRPLTAEYRVTAACHDLEQLRHADALAIDLALLSPLQSTTSHPGAPVLGWQRFAQLAGQVQLPVAGLGGVGPDQIAQVRQHGGCGIAAISALWD